MTLTNALEHIVDRRETDPDVTYVAFIDWGSDDANENTPVFFWSESMGCVVRKIPNHPVQPVYFDRKLINSGMMWEVAPAAEVEKILSRSF